MEQESTVTATAIRCTQPPKVAHLVAVRIRTHSLGFSSSALWLV